MRFVVALCASILVNFSVKDWYTGGDRQLYVKFFEIISAESSVIIGFRVYSDLLGAYEPFYYLIVFFFSKVMDKVWFDLVVDFLYIFNIIKMAEYFPRKRVLFLFVVFSSFYFYVLLFAAERLKLAVVVGLVVFRWFGRNASVAGFLGSLFHMQLIFLPLTIIAGQAMSNLVRNPFRWNKHIFVLGFFGCAIGAIFWDGLSRKFYIYLSISEFSDLLKPGFFLVLTWIFARSGQRVRTLGPIIILAFAALALGDDRVTMMAVVLFYVVVWNSLRKVKILFVTLSFYWFYKAVLFWVSIYLYGDGYVLS